MAIPAEYRPVTEGLFPSSGYPPGKGPTKQAAEAFAGILGIGADYRKVLSAPASGDIERLLLSFQNNLDLLIQKTWVGKADRCRKEKLQGQVPGLIGDIKSGNLVKAVVDFGVVLDELAYLFFGPQSRKDDFTEYTLRIDTQMGLFWWYCGQIGSAGGSAWIKSADKDCLKAILLLGICYLTNF